MHDGLYRLMTDNNSIDVETWVVSAGQPSLTEMRKAMHVILLAIATSAHLKQQMRMKGGVLLDIRYHTGRFTEDIDFSTFQKYKDFDEVQFIKEFNERLATVASEKYPGLVCIIQSHEVRPKSTDSSYQTLKLKIAYAYTGTNSYKKLNSGICPNVVEIDYSFNEKTGTVDKLIVDGNQELLAYSLVDQVAEKYRALIQQPLYRRNRQRRQDAYDIYKIIEMGLIATKEDKHDILVSLIQSCTSRGITVTREMILEPAIRTQSVAQYKTLTSEISEPLPEFDSLFGVVTTYFQSLPWPKP